MQGVGVHVRRQCDPTVLTQIFGTVTSLSQLTTLGEGRPSPGPTPASERMPLIIRLMRAHVTTPNASTAAALVSVHTGFDPEPVGSLGFEKRSGTRQSPRYALDIQY